MKKIITTLFLVALFFNSFATTTYYLGSSGAMNSTNSWWTNSNSTGTHPTSLGLANTIWKVINQSNISLTNLVTIASTSTVSVGNGVNPVTITVSTALGGIKNGYLDLNANSTFIISTGVTTTNLTATFNNFDVASTVTYSNTAWTVKPAYYGNLTIAKSTNVSSSDPSNIGTNVNGILTINASTTFSVTAGSAALYLYGNISGTGSLYANSLTQLYMLGGSGGNAGTLTFASGGNTLGTFAVQFDASSSSVTLGSDIIISDGGSGNGSTFVQSYGGINLNSHTVTCDASSYSGFPGDNASGVITGSSTSKISLNGSISGYLCMDQTSSSTKSLSILTVNPYDGSTLSIGNPMNIVDSICPTAGVIDASSAAVTLLADQTTVGHVGRIGVVGGSISGTVISQVYHKPNTNNTDWRLLGTAGISGAGFSQWNAVSTGGAGTIPMSCPTCPYTTASGQAFSSVTTYDETSDSYPDITYGSSISPGTGYWVYMGTTSPGTASAPILVTVSGSPVTGDVPIGLTSSGTGSNKGYNLVANPYASTISFAKLRVDNPTISNGWYTYSPAYGDNAAYVGGVSSPSYSYGGMGIDDIIPSGMGFYVQTNSATTLTFKEYQKKAGSNEVLLKQAHPNNTQANISYFRLQVNGSGMTNETVLRFDPTATASFNGDFDLYDFPSANWGWLQISSLSNGEAYTIKAFPDFTQNLSIPIRINTGTSGQYQISATDWNNIPAGACMKLHDNYTNQYYDITSGPFNVNISDTETVARFTLNITVSPLNITTNAVQTACPNDSTGFIVAIGNDAGPWNYTWKDGVGNVIKTSLNKATSDTLSRLNSGVYSVDVSEAGLCAGAMQTFTLTAPNAPAAAFNSSSQVNVGDNVTLANNSNNADAYIWNFGNGDISVAQTPTYAYSNAGTYTITLDAINSACQDTSVYTQIIQVDALTSGIHHLNSGNGNIFISQDASGNYIQFDYSTQTKVNIIVYNTLGQVLLNNAVMSVTNDKIYLNIPDSRNQVLYITITDLNSNQKTTKKLLNN